MYSGGHVSRVTARVQVRWTDVHETVKEWVARMTTLVECWNKLDGNVGELSSWVQKQVNYCFNLGIGNAVKFFIKFIV